MCSFFVFFFIYFPILIKKIKIGKYIKKIKKTINPAENFFINFCEPKKLQIPLEKKVPIRSENTFKIHYNISTKKNLKIWVKLTSAPPPIIPVSVWSAQITPYYRAIIFRKFVFSGPILSGNLRIIKCSNFPLLSGQNFQKRELQGPNP